MPTSLRNWTSWSVMRCSRVIAFTAAPMPLRLRQAISRCFARRSYLLTCISPDAVDELDRTHPETVSPRRADILVRSNTGTYPRVRSCEKIKKREKSISQTVDYQCAHFVILGLSPIFSQLLSDGGREPRRADILVRHSCPQQPWIFLAGPGHILSTGRFPELLRTRKSDSKAGIFVRSDRIQFVVSQG